MKISKKSLVENTIEILFVICILVSMSRDMIKQVYSIFNGNSIFSATVISLLYMTIFFIYIYIKLLNKNHVRVIPFLLSIGLFLIILLSSYFNTSDLSFVIDVRNLIFNYIGVFFILFSIAFNIRFKAVQSIFLVVFLFCSFQAIIGVFQYFLQDPLIPTEYQGEKITDVIYYYNGISNQNPKLLELGGVMRPFGMTDSAMTLGLFSLLGFMISLKINYKVIKFFSILLFIFSMYMTHTRLIWFGAVIFLIFRFILKRKQHKLVNNIYMLSVIAQIVFILLTNIIPYLQFTTFLGTLLSRLQGYNFFLSYLPLTWYSLLWGVNFTNILPQIETIYSVDNELLKSIFDIGFLGTFLLFYSYKKGLNLITNRSYLSFFLLFPIFGMLNVINYFFIPLIVIFILLRRECE